MWFFQAMSIANFIALSIDKVLLFLAKVIELYKCEDRMQAFDLNGLEALDLTRVKIKSNRMELTSMAESYTPEIFQRLILFYGNSSNL